MLNLLKKSYLILIYVLLYSPILVLIGYSFNSTRFSMQWHGGSLHWYRQLFHDQELWSAFFHSVLVGSCASLIATLLGFLVCVHVFLHPKPRYNKLMSSLMILIIIPDLVLAVALLIFFNLFKIPLGFISLLIAHITFCIPFVALTINNRIHTLDANIYFSALDLGAGAYKALTKVMLPLLWPSVLSAFLLCFTLSFDDIIISYFVSGPDFNLLPLTIYALVRTGISPELNALCSITFLISMILVISAYGLSRKTT